MVFIVYKSIKYKEGVAFPKKMKVIKQLSTRINASYTTPTNNAMLESTAIEFIAGNKTIMQHSDAEADWK
jgi:hypothetical protein